MLKEAGDTDSGSSVAGESEEQVAGAASDQQQQQQSRRPALQLAIAGLPNVGKSTLVNALLGAERVLTGPEAGLTRDSVRIPIRYRGQPVWLVDTAGWMRRAEEVRLGRGPASLAQVDTHRSLMRAHVVVLVVDGVQVALEQKALRRAEQSLARWVLQQGRALVLAINKMDAIGVPPSASPSAAPGREDRLADGDGGVGAGEERLEANGLGVREKEKADWKQRRWMRKKVREAVSKEVSFLLPQVAELPVVFTSALEGEGTDELMAAVTAAYDKWCTVIPNPQLRFWLPKALSKLPGQRAAATVRSLTQVKARPPTFVVTSPRNADVSPSTLKFLSSELASSFNLHGVPIRVLPQRTKVGT